MSWAEENGIDGGWEPEISDSKEYEWEDSHHSIKLISDLETSHIKNILKGFASAEAGTKYWGQRWKVGYLNKELEKRGEK